MLSIGVLAIWGAISFVLMPKQYNPEIVAPAFSITTELPGISSEETHDLLTRKIEDAISEIPNIDDISSQSFVGGRSVVGVKFIVGYPEKDATVAINQRIQDLRPSLPSNASAPLVQSIRPDDVPIIDIAISSPSLSETSLRKLALDVSDSLKLVPGVSTSDVKGGLVNHLQVKLDAKSLSARNITVSEVESAIVRSNGNLFSADIQGTSNNPFISVEGGIGDADELSRVVLRESEGGSVLRLGDVAEVSLEPNDISEYIRLSEKNRESVDTVHIVLSKLKGENATSVSNGVIEKIDSLKGSLIPDSVSVSVLRDEGKTASEEISKLSFDLVKSVAIVGILLALFLGSRNALVASVSIPLVLLAVFGVGLLAGQTINRITLFALILSLGLLVDDAIVVVENIVRSVRLFPNESRIKLIVRAVDEVGGALALSTIIMALAFIPMAFVSGMMGPYMGPIPFFVPAALFASLFISVTLNPFLAFLSMPRKIESTKENILVRSFEKIERMYVKTLSTLLRDSKRRKSALLATGFVLIIALILPLTPLVPFRMLPKADKDHFSVYVDLPNGTSLQKTEKATRALEAVLLKDPDILSVDSFVGAAPIADFNGLFKGSSGRNLESQSTLTAHLSSIHDRSVTSESIAFRVRDSIERNFRSSFPDAVTRIIEDPPGPPVLSTFLLKVKGPDAKTREEMASDFSVMSSKIAGVVDIDTSIPERTVDPTYRINSDKAILFGVSPNEIERSLQTALSGSNIGLFRSSDSGQIARKEPEYIMVRFAKEDRTKDQDLTNIQVLSNEGKSLPITEFLEPIDQSVEKTNFSDNREETTIVSAEMGNRSIIYAVIDLFPKLLHYRLPNNSGEVVSWSPFGVTYQDHSTGDQYRIEVGGEWKLTLEVFRDLGIVMGVVMFLIFFVLAARTKSFIVPGIIMVSIPLGLIGILPGFALLQAVKGTYFNATSMIGIIALSGLSVKNAVIYLEYLEPLRKSGMSIREALVEAGRIRLLPIILTSLAAILGSLTIVSDPVWEGLAWSIIFGLSASTVLTLIIFPLLYFVFERRHWEK